MRRRPYMQNLSGGVVYKCSYCEYNREYRKNTMLFSNITLVLRVCTHSSHSKVAQGGPSNGIPGVGDTVNLYAIPDELIDDVLRQGDLV